MAKPTSKSQTPPRIDWTRARDIFETTKTPVRAIARRFGISETAFRKRIKTEGWQRLNSPATAAASARQVVAVVPVPPRLAVFVDVEQKTIAANGLALALRMMSELDATTSRVGELDEMITAATESDTDGRRRTALQRAVDLPARSVILKNLAAAIKTLVDAKEPTAGAGKKEQAAAAAETAGQGSGWGDDLAPHTGALN